MSYRVLVRIEATMIESSVGIADRHSKGWSKSVWSEIIDEINVVRPKINVAERCTCGNRVA